MLQSPVSTFAPPGGDPTQTSVTIVDSWAEFLSGTFRISNEGTNLTTAALIVRY
jgi:hypothetical protein